MYLLGFRAGYRVSEFAVGQVGKTRSGRGVTFIFTYIPCTFRADILAVALFNFRYLVALLSFIIPHILRFSMDRVLLLSSECPILDLHSVQ